MVCSIGSPFINDFAIRIFKLHFCTCKLVSIHILFTYLNSYRLIYCYNFDNFSVLRNSHRVAFIAENISCGSFDFPDDILAVWDLVKFKVSVFIGNSGHICVVSSKLSSINSKQSEQSIFKRFLVFINLFTADFSTF